MSMKDWIICIGAFLDDHEGAVTAVSTVVIALFTVLLACYTRILARLSKNQEEAIRKHERAYVFSGGVLGVRMNPRPTPHELSRPSALHFGPVWRMAIY